jgi:hypothetical protein
MNQAMLVRDVSCSSWWSEFNSKVVHVIFVWNRVSMPLPVIISLLFHFCQSEVPRSATGLTRLHDVILPLVVLRTTPCALYGNLLLFYKAIMTDGCCHLLYNIILKYGNNL